jgi:PTH1 family peptidyl-tRNA hydrolase
LKLLVGLGNPGSQYERTRHNAGFIVLDELALAHKAQWQGEKFGGRFGRGNILGETCLLLEPLTFMNVSGRSVAQALSFYKIPPERMIVFHDDIDVPPGIVKTRFGGSPGGHNGIRSIIETIGTDQFHRIKLGLGKSSVPGMETTGWVLGSLSEAEMASLKGQMFNDAALRLQNIFKAQAS